MFCRANAALGANWTLHDLRHTAAYRMARDPEMPLTDVQWVLGHAHLSAPRRSTLTPAARGRDRRGARPPRPPRAPGRATVHQQAEPADGLVSAGDAEHPVRGGHRVTAQALTAARSGRSGSRPCRRRRCCRAFPPRDRSRAGRPPSSRASRCQRGCSRRRSSSTLPASQARRRAGIGKILALAGAVPRADLAGPVAGSGADAAGNIAWRRLRDRVAAVTTGCGLPGPKKRLRCPGQRACCVLISGDVIRPSLSWLLTPGTVQILTAEMARSRDPQGFAALAALCRQDPANTHTKDGALRRIATMMAAKGGTVSDITVGDCLELAAPAAEHRRSLDDTSAYFYQLLHAMGVFPDAAPPTVRVVNAKHQGQISVEQMIDRYDIACRPCATCSWTTCANANPRSTTPRCGPGVRPGQAVLEGPGDPPPGNRLAAPDARRRGSVETADRAENDPQQDRRRAERRGRAPARRSGHQLPGHGPGLLPRSRPMGDGRPRPLGHLGGSLPHPGRRDVAPKGTLRAASHAWTSGPANGCRCCRPWSHTVDTERRLTAERLQAAQAASPGRDVHRRRPDLAPAGHQESDRQDLG